MYNNIANFCDKTYNVTDVATTQLSINDVNNQSFLRENRCFREIEHINNFLTYCVYLREITISYINNHAYIDKISINIHKLDKVETWKYLIKLGVNQIAQCNYIMRKSSNNGHLELVRYFVEQGLIFVQIMIMLYESHHDRVI